MWVPLGRTEVGGSRERDRDVIELRTWRYEVVRDGPGAT